MLTILMNLSGCSSLKNDCTKRGVLFPPSSNYTSHLYAFISIKYLQKLKAQTHGPWCDQNLHSGEAGSFTAISECDAPYRAFWTPPQKVNGSSLTISGLYGSPFASRLVQGGAGGDQSRKGEEPGGDQGKIY